MYTTSASGSAASMAKRQINFRASDLTQRQLEALREWWGTTTTEALILAIDRAYREEATWRGLLSEASGDQEREP